MTPAQAASASQEAQSLTAQLRAVIQPTRRGVQTSPDELRRIQSIIAGLEQQPSSGNLSAVWELLWTTEKETLFILKNSQWLGGKAGEVYQIIDAEEGYLQNVITFPPGSAFRVDSRIEQEGAQRVNFQFTAAALQLPSRSLQLPPFGKGWFDTVYMDEDIRVSKDSRGDTLVCARAGPARRFADDMIR